MCVDWKCRCKGTVKCEARLGWRMSTFDDGNVVDVEWHSRGCYSVNNIHVLIFITRSYSLHVIRWIFIDASNDASYSVDSEENILCLLCILFRWIISTEYYSGEYARWTSRGVAVDGSTSEFTSDNQSRFTYANLRIHPPIYLVVLSRCIISLYYLP